MLETKQKVEKSSRIIKILNWVGKICVIIGVLLFIFLSLLMCIDYLTNPSEWKKPSQVPLLDSILLNFFFYGLPPVIFGVLLILTPKIIEKPLIRRNIPIIKNAILGVVYCWVLVSVYKLSFHVKHSLPMGFGWEVEGKSLMELSEEIISHGLVKWVFAYLFSTFFFIPFDMIVIVPLFIGFYFGLKFFYKNKYKFLLFLLPLFTGFVGAFLTLVLGMMGATGIGIAFAMAYIIVFIAVPYLFAALIISLVLYLRKERFLKLAIGILFIIAFLSLVGFGKYAEVRGMEEKRQVEAIEESVLKPLLKKAITNKDPALCEELKAEMNKIKKEVWWVWFYPEKYYNVCIKEVAKKLGDESLCERLEVEDDDMLCKKIVSNIKTFLKETDLCKEISEPKQKIECIKEIATNTNNADLCASIFDIDCVVEIAQKIGSPQACKQIKEVSYYNIRTAYQIECLNKLASLTKNPDMCEYIDDYIDRIICFRQIGMSEKEIELREKKCRDSDGGKNYYVKGEATVKGSGKVDCCMMEAEEGPCVKEGPYLHEAVCENNKPSSFFYKCPKGCRNGICVKEE
jgi:hypothetical protein